MIRQQIRIFLAVLLCIPVSCNESPFESALDDIDALIAADKRQDRSVISDDLSRLHDALCQAWTDSLLWDATYALFDYHFLKNTDSSLFYLNRMMDIQWTSDYVFRSKVCRAKSYSVDQRAKLDVLFPELVEAEVSSSFLPKYSSMMIDIWSHDPSLPFYASHYADFLEKAISEDIHDADTLSYYRGLCAVAYNRTGDAINHLTEAYELTSSHSLKARCAERLASIYHDLDNAFLEKQWLIYGARHQLLAGEGELTSLYRLSLILSDEGGFSRAAGYIRTVIERASVSGFPDIVVDSAAGSLAVTDSLDKIEKTRQMILFCAFALAVALFVMVTVFLIRDRSQNKVINRTKGALLKSNSQLVDANKIKDSFLVTYMNLSIQYLGMVEEYRRKLRRISKEEGVDALLAELRMPSIPMSSYKDFYSTFDDMFLSLYPDFREKVNRLFRPEDRFKDTGRLNTQLRILALIRLGFTESGEIARFLNCSPETVYSHRSRMKNRSLRDDFEKYIKSIE